MLRIIGAKALIVKAMVTLVAGVMLVTAIHPVQAQEAAPVIVTGTRVYTVNPGDEIEVYVWGEERLQRTIRVLPDGSFSFPLVGKVVASGKSPTQIEALITKGLEGQYRGQVPQVTVSVRNPSGLQFSVAGRVRNSGTFSPGRYVNLLEALSFAGGPAEFANLDNISIIRKTDAGLVTIRARLSAAFKGGVAARDVNANAIPQIESGDTVIVP